MQEAVDTVVAVLAMAVDAVDLEEEDLLLAVDEVEIEATERCLMPHAVTAAKIARFLLDPQTVNLCTVAIVLRRWVTGAIGLLTTDPDLMIELPVPLSLKEAQIWAQ
jgi:hypothetical protein